MSLPRLKGFMLFAFEVVTVLVNKKDSKMSAKTAEKSAATSEQASPTAVDYSKNIPKGYKQESNDVVGYWDNKVTPVIHFIPREVTLVDSSQDSRKPSALITGELVDDAVLVDSDKTPVQAKKGDLIGVWYANGMSAIAKLGGCKVIMYQEGEKRLKGRPSGQKPMKMYQISRDPKDTPCPIRVTADRREESRDVKTVFGSAAVEPAPF